MESESRTRRAILRMPDHYKDRREEWERSVMALLPDNYSLNDEGGAYYITGADAMGWTLDGYVIPRLASGNHYAEEVEV